MRKKIIITGSILMLLVSFHLRAQVLAQFVIPTEVPAKEKQTYVPNQVIVKFKKNNNPTILARQIVERERKELSFFGRVQLWLENMSYAIRNEVPPKTKLTRISAIDNQVGLVARTLVSTESPEADPDLFLITTEGSISVPEMVEKYQSLPEVEYAQPNNVFSIM